jgi:RNA 3'-terminal phosphate cyclase (ATP)
MLRLIGAGRITVFTAYGMKGKPSQEVVSEAVNLAKDFLSSGTAIDRFLADQLLIYMALSKAGRFTTNELSAHLLTNMEVIKKFLPVDFSIEREKQSYKVRCQAI